MLLKEGYKLTELEDLKDSDGSCVFIVHRYDEEPQGKFEELWIFDTRGDLGYTGVQVYDFRFNKFRTVFLGADT